MTDEIPDSPPDDVTFSPDEQAYIDSKGASDVPKADEPKVEEKPEAKAEEPAKDGEKEAEKEPEAVNLVPQGALQEERARRKKAEAERQALREKLAFYEGQKEALKPEAKAGDPGVKPDPEKDPIGYIKWKDAQDAAAEKAKAEAERIDAEQRRLAAISKRHADEFAKQKSDWNDTTVDGKTVPGAYNFLRQAAFDKLRSANPDDPAEKIWATINLAELGHTQECARNGINAAQALYDLAVEQGYKPPQPKPEAKPGPTEAERIAALEKAQKAAKSLGDVPSGGGEGEITLEALAAMDDDEFAAATSGKKWEKLKRSGALGA